MCEMAASTLATGMIGKVGIFLYNHGLNSQLDGARKGMSSPDSSLNGSSTFTLVTIAGSMRRSCPACPSITTFPLVRDRRLLLCSQCRAFSTQAISEEESSAPFGQNESYAFLNASISALWFCSCTKT